MIPDEIKRFIELFSKLPSIGPRQATRLAFYLLRRGSVFIQMLTQGLFALSTLKLCESCFFVHTKKDPLCTICANTQRHNDIYMVVEKETDLLSIEQTGSFTGTYMVLGELTRSGVLEEEQKKRIEVLQKTIRTRSGQQAKEIILALNPTTYGDLTASLIKKELAPYAEKITRIGRGIPIGGDIEFADEETLTHSLQRRE